MNGIMFVMRAAPLVVLLIALMGCEASMLPVEGYVTLDGQPLEQGVIEFEPADGNGPTSGGPIVNGRYELAGTARMPAGSKTVRIRAFRKTGKKIPPFPGSSERVDEMEQCVPKEYNDRSTQKVTVEAGKKNVIDFDIKLKPR
ncbi:hypothetical protein [Fimbriiglobus ruber]|uniref:Uncharacterized protein n=1 Tax=Fimbriiglobus ruber TaxID=1908690 RepID=A0A225D901_9BACT|nr:hypothetical protein [Fimbriiglobus ruber]OWK36124.1 hypothetical protein FRUB_08687 [Fimbriiglobus ruber]